MFSSYSNIIDKVKKVVTGKHRMCFQEAVTEGNLTPFTVYILVIIL